ncbi:hypothetical protein ACM66B_004512 [Microbotryomycetes sp. NB124-2]
MPPSAKLTTNGGLARRARKNSSPRRAPSKPVKTTETETTECINVSLLLRALLRSSALEAGAYDNLRHSNSTASSSGSSSSSSSSSSSVSAPGNRNNSSTSPTKHSPTKRVKRERDQLPPPAPGYGRGRRSQTPTSTRSADLGISSLQPPQALHTHTRHASTNSDGPARAMKRSASADRAHAPPASTTTTTATTPSAHLMPSTSLSPTSATRMARASSLGPHLHHAHTMHHAPSPLSRSFGASGQDDTAFTTTHQRSTSAGAQSIQSMLTNGEPRARRPELPKHFVQDFEITAA